MKKEITFNDLNATDKILIQTQNSDYSFSVVDPVHMRGLLSGGVLGNGPCVAILIGVLIVEGAVINRNPSSLTTDSRAFFYFEARHEHLITSVVTGLDHVKHGDYSGFRSNKNRKAQKAYGYWAKI